MGQNEIMANLVEVLGGDAGHDVLADHVQRFGGKPAGGAHGREILRPVN